MKLLYEDKRLYHFKMEENPRDFPVHIHNAVEVFIMLAGSCRAICENRSYSLQAGDIFFAFPNQLHGFEENRETRRYMLILPVKPYLETYYKTLTEFVPEEPVLHKGSWEHLHILPLVEQACSDVGIASEEIMQGYFTVIIGKLLSLMTLKSHSTDAENILRSVLLYIHGHYRESINRSQIARAVGYDESYISHVFSQVLHMGITRYVHMLRIDDAKKLLSHTDELVTAIATELGFGSIRNFNRVFLQETGMTPKEYRRRKNKKI